MRLIACTVSIRLRLQMAEGVRTQGLVIVDEAGVARARLGATSGGGCRLVLLDANGFERIGLTAEPGVGVLDLAGRSGTYHRAHVLANGGGRELAYVALSRARTGTTLHAIADDLPQLRHDLALDWHTDRSQRWIGSDPIEQVATAEHVPSADLTEVERLRSRLDALGSRSRSIDDDLGLGL